MVNKVLFLNNENMVISEKEINIVFNVENNSNSTVLVDDKCEVINSSVVIGDNSLFTMNIVSFSEQKSINLEVKVCKSSLFFLNIADFHQASSSGNINIKLDGLGAKVFINGAIFAGNNYCKKYNVSIIHNFEKTVSSIEIYGVSQDEANIALSCISHIKENCNKSSASQLTKIILVNENSKASSSPILKIDCDDIKAKHGCAIGSLNEDHLYYLQTRGISKENATKLIIAGYLLPIADKFDKENKNKIEEIVRGNI